MSARDIALSAYEQAMKAEEDRLAAIEIRRLADERARAAEHQKTFDAALVTLNEWFPDSQWEWYAAGDFGTDTIIQERGYEQFKLKALRHLTRAQKGFTVEEFEVGDYVLDRHSGYNYFSGTKINSPAELGRYLMNRDKK